jgi:hypothetical protein
MLKMDRCIIRNQKFIISRQPNILPKSLGQRPPQMRKTIKLIMEYMGIVAMGKTKQTAKRVGEGLTAAR